ncbi:hypothetical protein ACS72_12755 [Acinetobacter sp. VT 511]|nr:hypothetical protein ACS72_12755 [Acinetobacter sp. VT 511]
MNELFPTLLGTGDPQLVQKQEIKPESFLNVQMESVSETHSNTASFTNVAAFDPVPLCLRHKLQ